MFSISCSCLTPSENNWILENEIHKSNSTIISHFKWNTYSVYVKGQMYNNHQTIILAHFSDNLWSNHMMVLVKNFVENYETSGESYRAENVLWYRLLLSHCLEILHLIGTYHQRVCFVIIVACWPNACERCICCTIRL